MTIRFSTLAGGALALAVLTSSPAFADAGTQAHKAAKLGGPVPQLSDKDRSRLPLVAPDVFEALGRAAAKAEPGGQAGASTSSEDGTTIVKGDDGLAPAAFGTSTAPYTTKRVAVEVASTKGKAVGGIPVTSYPFRATGKLRVRFGTSWYVCSASLVKPGVLVTAAHCVFDYGQGSAGWADEVWFYPANYSSTLGEPYGAVQGSTWRILTPYLNGTDTCTQVGVVCNNDIATVTLIPNPRKGYIGATVGWYAYGWNGYSYVTSGFLGNVTAVQIAQLGYPAAFDSGYQMQRTDAVGWYLASGNLKNTQIGSAQTGGSSGGPWLVNLGATPSVTASASLGSAIVQAVVGVTSYGSTTIGYNRQGSSYFGQNLEYPAADYGGYGAGNIGLLIRDTCTATPAAC
jgi:V8-like Glu-specific endopeptidase